MLGNQEPDRNFRDRNGDDRHVEDRNIEDRNIEDVTDQQICAAIHYLERHPQPNEEQHEEGSRLAAAIILLGLLCGLIAFVWLYR